MAGGSPCRQAWLVLGAGVLLSPASAAANGFGWDPVSHLFVPYYEAAVVVFEALVLWLALGARLRLALVLSLVANLASFIVGVGVAFLGSLMTGMVLFGAGLPPEYPLVKMVIAVHVLVLGTNWLSECAVVGAVLRPRNAWKSDARFLRIMFRMNLVTWTAGLILFSYAVRWG